MVANGTNNTAIVLFSGVVARLDLTPNVSRATYFTVKVTTGEVLATKFASPG